MKSTLIFTTLFILSLSSCKKPASSSASVSETEKASQAKDQSTQRTQSEEVQKQAIAESAKKPELAKHDAFQSPSTKITGKYPQAWEGRSAEAEEKRLRDAGEWETKKLSFFEQWASVDPHAALEASRRTDRSSISVCTTAAVRGWAAVSEKSARAWVDSQPVNAERTMYVNALMKEQLDDKESDLTKLGDWLGGQTQLPGANVLISEFVTTWSSRDRDAALQWAQDTLENDAQREHVLMHLVRDASIKGEKEFFDTGKWIEKLPEGKLRNEMLYAYVLEASAFDKEVSKQWAELIQDEKIKSNALKLINPENNTKE